LVLSFPHGMFIKIIDCDSVEMYWTELIDNSHDMDINIEETKRTYFSNGFIMIQMRNGTTKIYSSNGTIFDIVSKRTSGKRNKNEELTKIYKFSITSIHFLQKYINNISTFVMTLPTGNRFIVENDWIVDKMQPLNDVRECYDKDEGNFNIVRGDGLRIVYNNAYTKCQLNDETIMTKTLCSEDIATAFSHETELQKSISILDEIWLTETENQSKNLVLNILNFVNDEYYVKINQCFQIEHRKYGTVLFTKKGIEMKLFNGMTLSKQFDDYNITVDGFSFSINDSKIEFFDAQCHECCK
jgi:hypothetical protein